MNAKQLREIDATLEQILHLTESYVGLCRGSWNMREEGDFLDFKDSIHDELLKLEDKKCDG